MPGGETRHRGHANSVTDNKIKLTIGQKSCTFAEAGDRRIEVTANAIVCGPVETMADSTMLVVFVFTVLKIFGGGRYWIGLAGRITAHPFAEHVSGDPSFGGGRTRGGVPLHPRHYQKQQQYNRDHHSDHRYGQ